MFEHPAPKASKQYLSAADIEELLHDPNSWLSKLYNQLVLEFKIARSELIHTILQLELENKRLAQTAEGGDEKRPIWERLETMIPLVPVTDKTVAEKPEADKRQLEIELAGLIAKPQQNMSPVQLAVHYQQLMANYNQQLAAKIGPQIVLQNLALPAANGGQPINIPNLNLKVPDKIKPAAPLMQVLEHNKGLLQQIDSEVVLEDLAAHHAHAGLGHLNAINYFRSIVDMDENYQKLAELKINVDSALLVKKVIAAYDKQSKGCLKQEIFDDLHQALAENNKYAVQKWFNVGLKPEMSTTPGSKSQS